MHIWRSSDNNSKTIIGITDPAVFAVNRVEAHSDHRYFETIAEAEAEAEAGGGAMELHYSVNVAWKFPYSSKQGVPADFYKMGFSIGSLDFIEFPGHAQLQGAMVSRMM